MPEFSLAPFGGQGTVEDANKIKAAVPAAKKVLVEKFGADPAEVDKEFGVAGNIGSAVTEGLEFGAELAAAGRVIPGRIGGYLSALFVGQHRDPNTGKYGLGQPFVYNAAPSPVGYAPASKFGLSKNFYLPAGVVIHTPEVIDQLGIGLPEQRAEDERNERLRFDAKLREQLVVLSGFSNESLEKIAAQGPLTTGQRIGRFFAPVTPPDLERRSEAAKFLLAQRAAAARAVAQQGLGAPATPENVAEAAEAIFILAAAARLDAAERAAVRAAVAPFGLVPLPGSLHPTLVRAVTYQQLANQRSARGINRELVSERVDP